MISEIVAYIVLFVTLIVPFILILPGLLELVFGTDFSKSGGTGQEPESSGDGGSQSS